MGAPCLLRVCSQWSSQVTPILMGMSKAMHVLQRGSEVEEIADIAAMAVVDAREG